MKLGQKVVCVDATPHQGGIVKLIAGNVYTIQGMQIWCCAEVVHVGLATTFGYMKCSVCGARKQSDDAWHLASRFRPLEEKSETMIETVLESIREKV